MKKTFLLNVILNIFFLLKNHDMKYILNHFLGTNFKNIYKKNSFRKKFKNIVEKNLKVYNC